MIFTVAYKEFRSLFLSPLAWAILAIVQFILAYKFLANIEHFINVQGQLRQTSSTIGATDIVVTPLLAMMSFLLMSITPLITMRLISEERRNKTLALLLASPITSHAIILGKLLSVLMFMLICLSLNTIMIITISHATALDFGKIFSSLLGISLLLTMFAAIGIYISCLNSNPATAAIITFGVFFILWTLNAGNTHSLQSSAILAWLSSTQHQESFYRGLLDSADISYYIIFTILFITLSIRRLDNERLQDR